MLSSKLMRIKCRRSLTTSRSGTATNRSGLLVAVYKVLRSSVHEVVSFSVYEVTRFHTKSPERAYHFALFGSWPG